METNCRICFSENGVTIFPPGLDAFFRQIEQRHSLHAAVNHLNASYRFVRGIIRKTEKRPGIRLRERNPADNTLQLSEIAKALLEILSELENDINPILRKAAAGMSALKNCDITK